MRMLLVFIFSTNTLFAECDWKTIQQSGDKFIYSTECHKEVGRLVLLNDKSEEEISLLRKSLEAKDLALQDADKRVIVWKDEAYKQYDFLQKSKDREAYYYAGWFIAGFASVLVGAWSIKQVK
jgi:hypothetical protein